jgi:hypothetical protein
MKIMLRAAIAALSIASIGPALADGGDGPAANTFFSELPGVIACRRRRASADPTRARGADSSGLCCRVPRRRVGRRYCRPIPVFLSGRMMGRWQ